RPGSGRLPYRQVPLLDSRRRHLRPHHPALHPGLPAVRGPRVRRRSRRAHLAGPCDRGRVGHQTRSPMVSRLAGTSTVRTTSVSSSTPSATAVPTSAMLTWGIWVSAANVAARTTPAAVITPPVTP